MSKTDAEYMAEYRKKNRAKFNAYNAAYRARHPERLNNSLRRWKSKNPEKERAHNRLNQALARGDIVRQPCEVCGIQRSQAHHDDYSKPLEVRWLCQQHHSDAHRKMREAP